MDNVALSSIAGVILSLAFSYIPGLRPWYEAQSSETKRLIMAALLLVVAAGTYVLSCTGTGIIDSIACDNNGIMELVNAFIAALVANQATYLISPPVASATPS